MAGGAKSNPERKCVLTGNTAQAATMLRLVEGPDGMMVPDVAAKLPGRGVWITSDKQLVDAAVEDGTLAKAISRSLKKQVKRDQIPADLTKISAKLLTKKLLNRLG